ncbi:CGNR zinc finger domain-containing protein [Streptomyces sp. NPDC088387]|uniref:CGNR zinc finger domain-containing protein n=1 Tax=Streptomyces sp. NPDC088387 TaxID=3365859 RepID=UPI003829351A
MTTEGVATTAVLLGEPLPVELMNTVTMDRAGRAQDALDSDSGAAVWLRAVAGRFAEAGMESGPSVEGEQGVAELRALRDALRMLASAATGDPRPPALPGEPARPAAIGTLNALARAWPELVWDEGESPSRVYRGSGTEGAVRLIAHQGVQLFTGPDRERLRPCLAPNCALFFVRNHARREWCSPVCGNRVRVARHYRRHHASPES